MKRQSTWLARAIVLCIATTLLCGCARVTGLFDRSSSNSVKPNPLPTLTGSFQPRTVWAQSVNDGARSHYLKLVPAVLGNRLFVADFRGNLSAHRLDTGETVWSERTRLPISGGPGAGEGLVVAGTEEGEIAAFSAADGKSQWKVQLTSEILAAPQIAEGVVVVRTVDGRLYGLQASNGKTIWIYDRSVPTLSLRGTSAPALSDGLAVGGFDSGRIVAVGLTDGREVWEARVSVPSGRTELQRLVDVDAEPVIADGVTYAVTFQGRLVALDARTGEALWRREMSSHSGIALDERRIFVSDTEGVIWGLSRDTSSTLWRQEKLKGRRLGAPATYRGYLLVGDFEGYVHWLDAATGEILGRVRVGDDEVLVRPVVAGDVVYVLGNGGDLAALSAPARGR